ncbi:MAG TPA: hypothetical protein VGF86_01200 [Candidatus Tumulicola sp.]|jgi:hypothetical protein
MTNPQQPLSDVLYWLALEESKPTAALIDEYRERFPEYAEAITEFALELAVDALRPELTDFDVETVTAPPSTVVLKSISHFQNTRYQVAKERRVNDAPSISEAENALPIANPFSKLNVDQFRRLARDLDTTSIFVAKLRDRQIVPASIPPAFTQRVATKLGVPVDLVIAHFFAKETQGPTRVYYKAVDKPTRQPQETFEEAVRNSNLLSEQQERLLKH